MRVGRGLEAGLLAPLLLVLVGIIVIPAIILAGYSLFDWVFASPQGPLTLLNYQEIADSPIALKVASTTVAIALPVTLISVSGGYALAYYIVFGTGMGRRLLLLLVLTALMASYLVRIYSWRVLLGSTGVMNGALTSLGLIDQPIDFLIFSRTAVIIAEISLFMPLATVIFFAALSGIPTDLREAARDLGASRLRTLLRVTLPLSGPAVLVTLALTFFLAAGDFITPVYVGGPESVTIGRLIADDFGASANYGRGAAYSMIMLAVFTILYLCLRAVMRKSGLLPAHSS